MLSFQNKFCFSLPDQILKEQVQTQEKLNICLHKNLRTETAARNTICVFFSLRCFNILCRWHWHCSWALCNHEPIQTLWIINILQHDAINNLLLGTSENSSAVLSVASTGEKSYWKLLMEVPKIVSVEFISLWGRLHHPVLRSNLRPNGTIQLPAARHHWHCAPLTARSFWEIFLQWFLRQQSNDEWLWKSVEDGELWTIFTAKWTKTIFKIIGCEPVVIPVPYHELYRARDQCRCKFSRCKLNFSVILL